MLLTSPFGGRSRTPQGWGLHLAEQIDELRRGGSRIEAVLSLPDAEQMVGETL